MAGLILFQPTQKKTAETRFSLKTICFPRRHDGTGSTVRRDAGRLSRRGSAVIAARARPRPFGCAVERAPAVVAQLRHTRQARSHSAQLEPAKRFQVLASWAGVVALAAHHSAFYCGERCRYSPRQPLASQQSAAGTSTKKLASSGLALLSPGTLDTTSHTHPLSFSETPLTYSVAHTHPFHSLPHTPPTPRT